MERTEAQKEYAVAAALKTAQGRNEIGQTMLEPFKQGRDYVGIGRKCFYVDKLPTAAPMWYDKDPQFSAVIISQRGSVPYERIEGDRVELEPIPIAVWVKIPVLEIAVRRFNILDREQVRARAEMAESEDTKVLSAISTATTTATGRNTTQVSTGGLTRNILAALFAEIEQHDAPVANIIMHPINYKDIRGWAKDEFDPVTKREMLKTGYVGDIWNSQLRVTKKQTSGTVYALADPEFMGVISVRIDLDQMDAPDQENLCLGWIFYEYVGISVIIVQGSAKATITGSIA